MASVFQNLNRSRDNTLTFRLSPTHVSYANTLRRLAMTSVEMVGFRADIRDDGATTDVEILANSTPMTNEMLAHRVGLLPIHVTQPLEWDSTKYEFVLNKVNDTEQVMDVFASDFQVFEIRGEEKVPVPSTRFFKPNKETHDTCLLAVLKPLTPGGKPEEVRIRAKATIGIGRENARYIPTSQCAYAYTRDEDPVRQKEVFDDWVRRAKKVDPAALEQDAARRAVLMREFNTLEINRCYLKNDKGEPYSFDFTVESVGVLEPEAIILRACEAGADLCKQFATENLPASVTVQRVDGQLLGWDFFFQKQDHTLGHLIQAWLDENRMGDGQITFVGYDIPHPLRDEMVIRIGVADGEEATARQALNQAMTACQGMFQMWRDQWAALVSPTKLGATGSTASAAAAPTVRRAIRRPTKA